MTRRTRDERMALAFTQELHPAGGVTGSTLLALVPVFTLLVALAVLRVTAWLAVIIGSVVTILLALFVWAVVAPILIALGVVEIEALRVSAIANNAPVSFGALGAPLIGLSKVTKIDIMDLSSAVGPLVALLRLVPPAILILLVSGWRGLRTGWPLAVAGSLGYIAGQYPIAEFVGPYLPDIVGSLTAFATVFLLIRFWRPPEVLGFGGVPAGGAAPAGRGSAAGARSPVRPDPVPDPDRRRGGVDGAMVEAFPAAL